VLNEVGVLISSNSRGVNTEAGSAGTITIQGVNGPGSPAKSVTLNDTNLSTKVFGGTAETRPASITITADSVALGTAADPVGLARGVIIEAVTAGPAPAGHIALNVNTLQANVTPDGTPIKGATGVVFNSQSQSTDRTGGPAGTVTISGLAPEPTDAAKLVALDKIVIITSVRGGTATTPPAAITITADTLALSSEIGAPSFEAATGEAEIFASSSGDAPAGNVAFNVNTLRANVNPDGTPMGHGYGFVGTFSQSPDSATGHAGSVTISGPAPVSTDAAALVALNNFSINTQIAGGTTGTVPSEVTITAHTLNFSGKIRTNDLGFRTGILASSSGSAPAGDVALNVDTLSTINTNFSSSSTSTAENAGHAGRITVQGVAGAGSLPSAVMLNRTDIHTEADAGVGGSIALASATGITLTDSTISTAVAGGSQPGGDITLSAADHITLPGGSVISARSTGSGDAGNILINAGNQFVMTNSSMTTEANQASGGAIKINTVPSGTVELTNSNISASVLDGTGGGGSVNIDPQFVILQSSQILADAVFGAGGNISITTNLLLTDSTSIISASSQFGQQGTIFIQSPVAPASGKIVPLGQKPLIETTLLSQRCAAVADGRSSSFTVAGRDTLPVEPGNWLSSPLALNVSGEGEASPTSHTPVEEIPLLSLRRIAPPGFLTQSFAVDSAGGCTS
jgi:hypothetical protein